VFNQEGVVINSGFKRISLRGNLDQSIGEKFRLASTVTLSRVSSRSIPTDGSLNAGAGAVGAAINYYPILPVRQANGSYTLMSQNSPSAILQPTNIANPVSMANDVTDKLGDTRVLANAFGEYDLLRGLKLRVSLGTDLSNRTRDTYYPRTTLMGSQVNGQAKRGTTSTTNFLNENTLSYNRAFGSGQLLDAVVGYNRQQSDLLNSQISNSNFVSDIDVFESIGSGTQTGGPQVSSAHTRWTLASYLGRLNYTLANRYLFTLTGRRRRLVALRRRSSVGLLPVGALRLARVGRAVHVEVHEDRAAQAPRVVRTRRQPGDQAVSIDGALVVEAIHVRRRGRAGLLPGVGRQSESRLGNDAPARSRSRHWIVQRPREPDGRSLSKEDRRPAPRGQPSLRGRVRDGASERRLSAKQRLRARSSRSRFLDNKSKNSLGWTTTVNYSHNKNEVLDLGGVTQIFASSVNSDLKLLGSLIQVGQPLGVFFGYQAAGLLRDSASAADYTKAVKPISGNVVEARRREAARSRRKERREWRRHRTRWADQRGRPNDHRRSRIRNSPPAG
jgi:hypothetical protein